MRPLTTRAAVGLLVLLGAAAVTTASLRGRGQQVSSVSGISVELIALHTAAAAAVAAGGATHPSGFCSSY